MRRSRVLALSVAAVVVAGSAAVAGVVLTRDVDPYTPISATLNYTHLDPLSEPAPAVAAAPSIPKPRFTRTTFDETRLAAMTPALDACEGPVASRIGKGHPVLVAEHDYCGGSDWISKLDDGDTVRLGGPGVTRGVYQVTRIKYGERNNVFVKDLPEGDVTLQTCVSQTRLVLVGLERVSDAS